MKYKIFPPLGIARVGNSDGEFFIGPETPGSCGTELIPDGGEREVALFKDGGLRVKRQAARFRIFESDDVGGPSRPAAFPAGTVVHWSVSLANKKDAVIRGNAPDREQPNSPTLHPLPTLDATRANRAIAASGRVTAGSPGVRLEGTYLTGTPREATVLLGEMRTDTAGHLLVLGGHGVSRSPEDMPIGNELGGGGFYNNRGWYDDVSDGPVTAEIRVPGQAMVAPSPAWVIVAPPDFAPGTPAVVTLYDVLFQVAIKREEAVRPQPPSFSRDIWPILKRAAGTAWVNQRTINGRLFWTGFSTNWDDLRKTSNEAKTLRESTLRQLREIGARSILNNFSLRPWQDAILEDWAAGRFVDDYDGTLPGAGALSAEGLTRTALDATAGQGFFPGIEAGVLVTNKTLYAEPFRIAAHVRAGDLTALMALPWQADFVDCEGAWWPSQRPDVAPQRGQPAVFLPWLRPLDPLEGAHRTFTADFGKFGVVAPTEDGVMAEVGRDPSL